MLKSSLSYSSLSFNSYIPMKLVKTITGEPVTTESAAIEADEKNKEYLKYVPHSLTALVK